VEILQGLSQGDVVVAGAGDDVEALAELSPLGAVEDVAFRHADQLHVAAAVLLDDDVAARVAVVVDQELVDRAPGVVVPLLERR